MSIKQEYLAWLRASYRYYIKYAPEGTGMSDEEWDALGHKLYEQRETLSQDEFPILFSEGWEGGSIYFIPEDEYPIEAKQ